MAINQKAIERFLKNFEGAYLCQKVTNTAKAGFKEVVFDKKYSNPFNRLDKDTDLYFYVNGGPKKEDVETINACFVDLDAGRDTKGKYFKKSIVDRKKKSMLKAIEKFPVVPHFVIETRNGYQVYWLVNVNLNFKYKASDVNRASLINKWETCQKRIASFFKNHGADPAVLKLNQILRVPYSTWYKTYEGKSETFEVKPVSMPYPKSKYDLDDIATATSSIKIEKVNRPGQESYKRPGGYVVNTLNMPTPVASSKTDDKLLHDVLDYLNEVAGLLYSKGAKYSSKQARELVSRIQQTYHIS